MRHIIALVVVFGISLVSSQGLGDRLSRGYRSYDSLPLTTTQAVSLKWSPVNTTCIRGLGVPYSLNGAKGASKSKPMIIYYTLGGQVASMSMNLYGEPTAPAGYWRRLDAGKYFMAVSFRNSSQVCSVGPFPEIVGNQLVVNQDSNSIIEIPTTLTGISGNWTQGSCFDTMGTHYFYDVTTRSPKMTWKAQNMVPIVPMYYQGKLNAFFFSSTSVQQQILPLPSANMWDGIALPNLLMCYNWCDKSCTFADTSFWSTLHIYFGDEKKVICGGGCSIGCCPGLTHTDAENKDMMTMMDGMM